jgi:hypothetical protein
MPSPCLYLALWGSFPWTSLFDGPNIVHLWRNPVALYCTESSFAHDISSTLCAPSAPLRPCSVCRAPQNVRGTHHIRVILLWCGSPTGPSTTATTARRTSATPCASSARSARTLTFACSASAWEWRSTHTETAMPTASWTTSPSPCFIPTGGCAVVLMQQMSACHSSRFLEACHGGRFSQQELVAVHFAWRLQTRRRFAVALPATLNAQYSAYPRALRCI